MQYSQPYGVSDTNASYVNGNPATGVAGSIPPAAAFEETQREIVNFVSNSGQTPDHTKLDQLTRAARRQAGNWLVDTGTSDALVVTPTPTMDVYTPGLPLRVKKGNAANATTTPTINVSGLGPKTIVRADGTALHVSDLPPGGVFELVYDGASFRLMTQPATTVVQQTVNVTGSGVSYIDSAVVKTSMPRWTGRRITRSRKADR
jgi:hypothetical protein